MENEVGQQFREASSAVERMRWRIRSALFPKRVSGWRAAGLVVGIALGVLLASRLFWLGIALPATSWKLIAFSAMYFSFCIWALAPLVPERFSRNVVCMGIVALAASVILVQLVPGA